MKKKLLLLSITLLLSILSCTTVPITGRKQLTLIPGDQILALSQQNYKDVLAESKLSNNQAEVKRLRQIGDRIVVAVEKYLNAKGHGELLQGYEWEFNLIESEQANAWAMPGGKVAFYTGIMPICKNDDGVAVVMSHEIAHAIAQHGNERMSQQMVAQMGGVALDAAMESQPDETRAIAMAAFGLGAQYGVLLPYSRKQESEADELGLYFLTMAGYDPYEAPRFWERMNAGAGSTPPEILSTHPSPQTRIDNMKRLIPQVVDYVKNSQ